MPKQQRLYLRERLAAVLKTTTTPGMISEKWPDLIPREGVPEWIAKLQDSDGPDPRVSCLVHAWRVEPSIRSYVGNVLLLVAWPRLHALAKRQFKPPSLSRNEIMSEALTCFLRAVATRKLGPDPLASLLRSTECLLGRRMLQLRRGSRETLVEPDLFIGAIHPADDSPRLLIDRARHRWQLTPLEASTLLESHLSGVPLDEVAERRGLSRKDAARLRSEVRALVGRRMSRAQRRERIWRFRLMKST